MKRNLLILLIIAFFTNANAQSFLGENKIWSVYELLEDETQPRTKYYKFDGEILVNSIPYKRVYHSLTKDSWLGYSKLVREDSNRVYGIVVGDNSKEFLLYDFNLKVGDYYYQSWDRYFINPYVVDSIVIRNVLGANRKHWYFSQVEAALEPFLAEVWIEGIGSLTDPLTPIGWGFVGAVRELICVHEGDTQIYQNTNFSGCEANTSAAPIIADKKQLIELYSSGEKVIQIQLKNDQYGMFNLYGIDGRKFLSKRINQGESQISVPSNGIFIYRFTNPKGETQTGKVVVR